MKKLTALLLALLMITSCMVFGVSAAETTAADALQIIPVSDGSGTNTLSGIGTADVSGEGWWGNTLKEGDKTVATAARYGEDETIVSTVYGMPSIQYAGEVINVAFHTTENARDISNMNMLVFDLYLENAAGVVNAGFEFELRSTGWTYTTGDKSERNFNSTLKDLVGYALEDGWNHIEIPLSKFTTNAAFDPTQWCYFRMYNYNATDKEGNVTNYNNMIGTEGVNTVLKIDNMYFSSATEVTAATDGVDYMVKGLAQKTFTSTSATGAMQVIMDLADTTIDIRGRQYLEFDVFVSNLDAGVTCFDIELTSSGTYDANEEGWSNLSLSKMATLSGTTLAKGWNHFKLPLKDRFNGSLDAGAVNWLRFFNRGNPAYTVENASHTIMIARAGVTGAPAELQLIGTGESQTSNFASVNSKNVSAAFSDVVTADGTVGTDGVNEWVWFNSAESLAVGYGNDFAWFTLKDGKLPYCENFGGITFEIWMSDASFATKKLNIELTSAKTCDKEEISFSGSLNTLMGTTLEAGKWQTVTIPVSKLSANGEFKPYEYDYLRLWMHEDGGTTFENGLTVAARDIYALNYATITETENGNPVINMESLTSGNRFKMTGVDGNPNNYVANMLNVAAGGALVTTGASNVNDSVLASAIDISDCDYIGFDLYLENLEDWGDTVKFLMGISSSGTCDYQQLTTAGFTIKQMFGEFVVNADGTQGELKNGWNRIEAPIYTLFFGAAAKYEDTVAENLRGAFNPENLNYFRTYVQPGTATTAVGKCVAAIDNMTFFDGDTIGTRDDVYTWGFGEKFAKIWTGAVAQGNRQKFALNHPMDISDKDTLVMDVYVEKLADYTGNFVLEVSSNPNCDNNEAQIAVYMDQLGAVEGKWTTVEIPLSSFNNTWSSVDLENIIRLEIFNNSAALPEGYQLWVDNVHFVKKGGFGPAITSAQPSLTQTIDFTTKATVPTATATAAAVEYTLTGEAGTVKSVVPATLLSTSTNGMSAVYTSGFNGITAHRMTDTLSMTLWYTDADGILCKGATKDYSVQQYAKNMLAANADNTALVTLLSDLLTYGAAAQTYAAYNADNMANAVEGLTPSTFTAPTALTEVVVGTAADDDFDATFKSATLVLDGTVKIRYTFAANTVEGLTMTVAGNEYTEFVDAGDGLYYVDVPVYANSFATTYTAHFGTNEAYAVNYSVNHYIAKMHGTAGTKFKALLEALYNYGASAVAYAAQ